MTSQQLIASNRVAAVELANGAHRIRLALWLANEFDGGDLVRFADDAAVSVEGIDKPCSNYTSANWLSGVASGTLYAFRTLRIPRQRVVVTELTGRLRSSDMDALASAAAMAVSALANQELSQRCGQRWTNQIQVIERSPSETAQPHDVVERAR
ncbi:MAG TPA: hypothetical protein VJ783_27485 [Pirellulales bacterium]|nr:hypothetical protein [Pirellulales bacterium]